MSYRKKVKRNNISRQSGNNEHAPFIHEKLADNIDEIHHILGNSSDLQIKVFQIDPSNSVHASLVYLKGLSEEQSIDDFIATIALRNQTNIKEHLDQLPIGDLEKSSDWGSVIQSILSGDLVLLIDGIDNGFILETDKQNFRSVEESKAEPVVRGPKESFTETLEVNVAMIRRKLKDPNLQIKSTKIGRSTNTDVAVLHLKGIANEKIVQEVNDRLDQIDIDGIFESGNIEELIEDKTFTPFPTMFNSEKPDVIAAGLLEGKIAIIIDGTPFVLLVPALFIQFFQSAEDYYQRWDISSLLRLLRVFSFFISLLGPAFYIALTTFHHEMLPTNLLISLAAQREGIPFPAIFEAILMEVTLEILREAGIRLPVAVGQTISIVGALVIGQAAVEAGFVSPAMVIVVSITAISNFIIPSYNLAISIRILRFLFMLSAATFGLYGIALGLFALSLHLCSLRSFGVPYMSPLAPYNNQDQKDSLIRMPQNYLFTRPKLIQQNNTVRQNAKSSK
ncbi:spore germination protein [Pseudalkalibacillus berkeleyi]|uniref:Spore germination protein n=1 Tax=Pseudalkalibacillus berkeleyi TaxID=1069813 RepID=A0ABS9H056_9BACL|nr:spore germination protein [Pseudalkalibacillus berkeleyi]MCF6137461.1 spore germination protein [Pseudalkalibacillus berkeleyi]